MKKKFIIFGTGQDCKRMLENYPGALDHVLAFTSNHPHKTFFDKPVIPPGEICKCEYDSIVIATRKFLLPLVRQCCNELHIDLSKIKTMQEFIGGLLCSGDILPYKIRVDACTLCQLNCAGCYMRLNDHAVTGDGYLKFSDFKRLVDENKNIREIELSNSGEVFLNPEFVEILYYAHDNNIAIYLENGVNFNTVSDEQIEALVKAQVRHIVFSIDGASQETYSAYRRRGNLDQVIRNIHRLNAAKEKYSSEYPYLTWKFILMRHNDHEVLKAKQMAKELKMGISYALTVSDDEYVPHDPDFLREVTGLKYLTLRESMEHTKRPYYSFCSQLYDAPSINYDGKLLGCCNIFKSYFGVNVFEVGLKNALQSSEYVNTKKMLLGDQSVTVSENNPCRNCPTYKAMVNTNQFFQMEDIEI